METAKIRILKQLLQGFRLLELVLATVALCFILAGMASALVPSWRKLRDGAILETPKLAFLCTALLLLFYFLHQIVYLRGVKKNLAKWRRMAVRQSAEDDHGLRNLVLSLPRYSGLIFLSGTIGSVFSPIILASLALLSLLLAFILRQ